MASHLITARSLNQSYTLGVACNLKAYYAGAAASSLAVVWKLQATVSMRGLFL